MKVVNLVIFLGLILALPQASIAATAGKAKKPAKKAVVEAPVNWAETAKIELEKAQTEVITTRTKKSGVKADAKVESAPSTPTAVTGELPTPATVRADAADYKPAIERTALKLGLTFEPYQPSGTSQFGIGESIDYSTLQSGALAQFEFRWLPFEMGQMTGGGYAAVGYSRHTMPLVAPSGFRYEDVALNVLRTEVGAAVGSPIATNWGVEAKLGVGRLANIQTSKYADAVASFNRSYLLVAADLSYYLTPRFALLAGVAKRTPIDDGTGAIAFDPFTVSGGILVQVR